jgi:hypothetical protein
MNRKLLNESRKAMSRNKFLRGLVKSGKLFGVNTVSDKSRSDLLSSDKKNINRLKSLSK